MENYIPPRENYTVSKHSAVTIYNVITGWRGAADGLYLSGTGSGWQGEGERAGLGWAGLGRHGDGDGLDGGGHRMGGRRLLRPNYYNKVNQWIS